MVSYSSLEGENLPIGRAATDRLAELPEWIRRELRADLSIPQLAQRACLCPRHFSRIFKRLFNVTPGDFVEQLRVAEAALRLAAQKNTTVDEVADAVGFRSSDVFRRAFERRYGMPPKRYQRQLLGEPLRPKKRRIRRRCNAAGNEPCDLAG